MKCRQKEILKGREDEEEDVSSYCMALIKRRYWALLENSL
jgi:hypothetical protein